MENKKLGGGIITISVIYLVTLGFGLLISIGSFAMLDEINSTVAQFGLPETTTVDLIISIVLNSLLLAGVILILCKKKFGVYTFFTVIIVNIIHSLIMNGFNVATLIGALSSLILPGLLAFFVYKKKDIFGFENNENNLNA